MHRFTLSVIALCVSLAGSVAISSGYDGGDPYLPGPTDGPLPIEASPPADALDRNKEMPVVGPDGKLIRCPQDGKLLLVTVAEAQAAPNLGQSELVHTPEPGDTVYEVTETSVPRCGPHGGGSADEAIWVPEHVGVESDVAPSGFLDAQGPPSPRLAPGE